MKILLDEGVPHALQKFLHRFSAKTVQELGFDGMKNGALLKAAKDAGFSIFITLDTNLQYQQNLAKIELQVIVIRAISNRLIHLEPLFPQVESLLVEGFSEKLHIIDGR